MVLHGGDDYRFIHVEEYGMVSAYRPRLSAGDIQTMVEVSVCVCGGGGGPGGGGEVGGSV